MTRTHTHGSFSTNPFHGCVKRSRSRSPVFCHPYIIASRVHSCRAGHFTSMTSFFLRMGTSAAVLRHSAKPSFIRGASSSWFSTSVTVPPPPTSNHHRTPLPNAAGKIIYTETDEAPALATYSLYPYLSKFSAVANIEVVPCDISLAGRVIAAFPDFLEEGQRIPDNLSYLGELTSDPDCCIVKLPNISAPLGQLQACVTELRSKGFNVPLYPVEPKNDAEINIQNRYQAIMGSAVNPVLREGNSDRRVALPVKQYAQKNPHRMVCCL